MGTSLADNRVRAWQETVLIPTYDVGEPNRNPMFLEKRVYQGSSGAVYPLPGYRSGRGRADTTGPTKRSSSKTSI